MQIQLMPLMLRKRQYRYLLLVSKRSDLIGDYMQQITLLRRTDAQTAVPRNRFNYK